MLILVELALAISIVYSGGAMSTSPASTLILQSPDWSPSLVSPLIPETYYIFTSFL